MKKVMIFPFIYIIVLLILGGLYIIWPNTLSLIKITEIGLSWPVLLVIFLFYFVCAYYDPIYTYLNEIQTIKTPWGETLRQKKSVETNNGKIKIAAYENIINALFKERKEYLGKTTEKDAKIKFLEKKVVDWMIMYANIFLVLKTKKILEIICNAASINTEFLKTLFFNMKINEQEGINTIKALSSLSFISTEKDLINITLLGKYYVYYMKSTKQI